MSMSAFSFETYFSLPEALEFMSGEIMMIDEASDGVEQNNFQSIFNSEMTWGKEREIFLKVDRAKIFEKVTNNKKKVDLEVSTEIGTSAGYRQNFHSFTQCYLDCQIPH